MVFSVARVVSNYCYVVCRSRIFYENQFSNPFRKCEQERKGKKKE